MVHASKHGSCTVVGSHWQTFPLSFVCYVMSDSRLCQWPSRHFVAVFSMRWSNYAPFPKCHMRPATEMHHQNPSCPKEMGRQKDGWLPFLTFQSSQCSLLPKTPVNHHIRHFTGTANLPPPPSFSPSKHTFLLRHSSPLECHHRSLMPARLQRQLSTLVNSAANGERD